MRDACVRRAERKKIRDVTGRNKREKCEGKTGASAENANLKKEKACGEREKSKGNAGKITARGILF